VERTRFPLREVARTLGCNPATVRRFVKAGRVPADLINGRWWVGRGDLFRSFGVEPGEECEVVHPGRRRGTGARKAVEAWAARAGGSSPLLRIGTEGDGVTDSLFVSADGAIAVHLSKRHAALHAAAREFGCPPDLAAVVAAIGERGWHPELIPWDGVWYRGVYLGHLPEPPAPPPAPGGVQMAFDWA